MQQPPWYTRDVSRETLEKLRLYAELIRKWSAKINLVSKASLEGLEDRHIWDSAQAYLPVDGEWLDFGSGGGLPAVVVAILAQGEGRELPVTMVESDQRKSAFLRTCARELSIPCKVVASRIEQIPPMQAEVVSARALADLNALLAMANPHLKADGICVFMKGATWRDEIERAQAEWRFSYVATQSKTNPEAAILHIKEIERV